MKKRGVELAISTLVVIILALSMLVFGMILVKRTYCLGINGIDSVSDLSEQEIQNLFSRQDNNVVVKELENKIFKGEYYGVGFVIKNEDKPSSTEFNYKIEVYDLGDCKITQTQAENYIITGKSKTISIATGNTYLDVIEFNIPKEAPLCSLNYQISVESNGEIYGSARFQVIIKQTSWINSAMC